MRAIDADAFMDTINRNCYPVQHDMTSIEPGMTRMGILQAIQEQPTIEPQRNKGKWIYGESEAGNDGYYCSKCGNFVPWKYDEYDIDFIKEFLFCNKCGADMREPEDIPMEYFESGGR